MADRLELYDVLVPAGTAKTSPQRTALHFDVGYLRKWQVVIPDGPAGLAGFRFEYAGQQLIPNNAGTFITGNDERIDDTVTYHFVGDQWTIVTYNTDVWAHTFHVRLYVDDLGDPAATVSVVPDVLPVTINAGTVDLSAPDETPLTLGGLPTFTAPDELAPLSLSADTVPVDTGDDVTPLDLPADAPPVIDDTVPPDDGTLTV